MFNIIIGAANFFQKYGITQEISSNKKIEDILKSCTKNKISIIDTAINYEIESNKINLSNDILCKFEIGTKISIKNLDSKKIGYLDNLLFSLKKSLNYWKKNEFKYIYCHDLLVSNKETDLFNLAFEKIKLEGFTKSIGLSIYNFSDIRKEIIPIIDRIQIPDNLYLQRSSEEINFLNNSSLTTDIRSIFLQGVIPYEGINFKKQIPAKLVEHHMKSLSISKKIGINMYDLAIGYIKRKSYSNIVIGVDKGIQINQFIDSLKKDIGSVNFQNFKFNSKFVDPRIW